MLLQQNEKHKRTVRLRAADRNNGWRRNTETRERRIAGAEHIASSAVLRATWGNLYGLQRGQGLTSKPYPDKVVFYQWTPLQCNLTLFAFVLFTDGAKRIWDGIWNFQNKHSWTDVSPHGIDPSRDQQRPYINRWIGILEETLVGRRRPVFKDRLKVAVYRSLYKAFFRGR